MQEAVYWNGEKVDFSSQSWPYLICREILKFLGWVTVINATVILWFIILECTCRGWMFRKLDVVMLIYGNLAMYMVMTVVQDCALKIGIPFYVPGFWTATIGYNIGLILLWQTYFRIMKMYGKVILSKKWQRVLL